jgi:hypothetical protein
MAYSADTLSIDYKRACGEELTTFNLVANKRFVNSAFKNIAHELQPSLIKPLVDEKKVKDIVSMFDYIEPGDIEFYNSLEPFQQLYEVDVALKIEVDRKLREKNLLKQQPRVKQEAPDIQKKQKKRKM